VRARNKERKKLRVRNRRQRDKLGMCAAERDDSERKNQTCVEKERESVRERDNRCVIEPTTCERAKESA